MVIIKEFFMINEIVYNIFMKKILLTLLLCILSNCVLANDGLNAVYLDLKAGENYEYNKSEPNLEKINVKKEEDDNEDYIYRPMEFVKSEARELYSKKSVSDKKEKKLGKATFGAKHDTTFAPDSMTQKRTLYSKYKVTDKVSVEADYQTNSLGGIDEQTKGSVGIGPEYQLNKKVKLKNKYSKNLGNNSNKGELSVEYKPFKDGRMDFNAGAAQIQQDDGTGSRSQVNFGTNFRF